MNDSLTKESSPQIKTFTPTVLFDNVPFTSALSVIMPQSLVVNFQELTSYLAEYKQKVKGKNGVDSLIEAASLTIQTLKSGEEKWNEILRQEKDVEYSLGRCIEERANTCFHRAIFFQYLMQQTGVSSQIIEGRWLTTDRIDLTTNPSQLELQFMLTNRTQFLEGEKWDDHLWNIVFTEGKYYLVDTSYLLASPSEMSQPVILEITDPDQIDVPLRIKNQPTRHYIKESKL